ncbi:MAG: TRAP transporter substrate-binding protein [Spirochaetales bacterium]|nr:TRAP transporter substrate-binding protein [Spirochaetales bacterium]
MVKCIASSLVVRVTLLLFVAGFAAAGGQQDATVGDEGMETVEWSLASVLPESHPVHETLLIFADKVGEKTDGGVEVTVYPGGQLGQEQDYIEGIRLETIDIAKVSSAPMGQFSESLQVVSLPFIFRDQEHQHAVLRGEIGARLMADLERNGFKGLTFLDSGFRNVTNQIRPVRTPEDLEGLKIRVMGSEPLIDTINAFGATAVPMGQSEVYVALQQGVIDGWENNQPTVVAFNMWEVAEYYSYTRHVSIPDILVMNLDTFNALPEGYQAAVMQAAAEAAVEHTEIWNAYISDAERMMRESGMIFNEVEDISAFQANAQPIYDKYGETVGMDLINAVINQ